MSRHRKASSWPFEVGLGNPEAAIRQAMAIAAPGPLWVVGFHRCRSQKRPSPANTKDGPRPQVGGPIERRVRRWPN
jgi:hypothetical protein